MDTELVGSVNDAAGIASSGRWKEFNGKIAHCTRNIEADNQWHFMLFGSMWHQTCSEYHALKDSYSAPSGNDLSLLAWRARNLLELRIWATYFCRSEQNARRIYEDAGRDGLDLFKALATWGRAADRVTDWETKFKDADAILRERAKEKGIDDLDGTFKAVRDAAEECGLGPDYRLQFKMFSKFAHPTAFQLIAPVDDPSWKPFRDAIFSQGCGLFALIFAGLENYLNSNAGQWETAASTGLPIRGSGSSGTETAFQNDLAPRGSIPRDCYCSRKPKRP